MVTNKTLIAYETKLGSTEEVAKKIADALRSKFQLEVDLVNLKKVANPNLTLYRNVVVGAGVRGGRIYGGALKFLKQDFSGKNVAFYTCSSWAGTPGSYENAKKKYTEKTLTKYPNIKFVCAEALGGRIRYFGKTMLDNRDPEKVEVWAEELGKKFIQ